MPRSSPLGWLLLGPLGVSVTYAWDRKCRECGSVWRPACPKWAAWMFVGIGAVAILIHYAVADWYPPFEVQVVTFCAMVMLLPFLVYGLGVFAGQFGQFKILHQGRGPNTVTCPNCGETVSKQADSCPYCGDVGYQLGRVLGRGIRYMVTCLKGLCKVVFHKSHRNGPGGP